MRLVERKEHLSQSGLDQIRTIIAGMNRKRKYPGLPRRGRILVTSPFTFLMECTVMYCNFCRKLSTSSLISNQLPSSGLTLIRTKFPPALQGRVQRKELD